MKKKPGWGHAVLTAAVAASLIFGMQATSAAHCDTLDGPVIQDARRALEAKDVTPVLKWVKHEDEKGVRTAFTKALAARGKKNEAAAENQFFAALVKIHRAGEGASFTGLKPKGGVEPVVAEADKSLANGSSDAVVELVADAAAAGIKKRFERAAATYKHKDESVEQGREFVAAYVAYTHYVEKLHQMAAGGGAHDEHDHAARPPSKQGSGESRHKH